MPILLFLSLAVGAAELPRGEVIEGIVCAERPDQSYALLLPSSYQPDKPAPVLYLLDARGRALLPIERFRKAAEEFGWILVSSYNSASDTTGDPNSPAINAMWNDTHARLAIDGRRAYLAGFSGTGRAAVAMAWHAPRLIAGVIGCAAGLPDEDASVLDLPFPYFGTVGDKDFNYYEMRELDARLSAAGTPHRIEYFDGGHDWPPAPVAREALAWMEVRAMQTESRPRDAAAAEALYREELARAGALESQGRKAEASELYGRVAEDFRGLTDVSQAAGKAMTTERDPSVRKASSQARRRDERDRATLRAAALTLHRAVSGPDLPLPGKVANDLGIAALKATAASADSPQERLSAERILANLRLQTSFYMPRSFLDRGAYPPALLLLAVAVEIDPQDPLPSYSLAAAAARAGQTSRALRELQRAVDKGFRRFESLEQDPDFAGLRGEPDFQRWLSAARK